jgi:hypothetical protein
MMPQPRDLKDFFKQMRWFFGAAERPRFEYFTYWEKFDYWAVLWGTLIMGAAGLLMWFPETASRIVPGWMFNVALFVHGAEATLAIGFIFVIHFFNGHLRPGKFPMDLVIFTVRSATGTAAGARRDVRSLSKKAANSIPCSCPRRPPSNCGAAASSAPSACRLASRWFSSSSTRSCSGGPT